MKIKILESSVWYRNFVGSEFEVDEYDRNHTTRLPFKVNGMGWVYESDCVITELPKSFCVKRCDDGIKWGKYIDWLNKTYNTDLCGRLFNFDNPSDYPYYGVIDNEGQGIKIPFGTEIHIDDMIKHIDYMVRHIKGGEIIKEETNMNTQKLSRQGLKEIHSNACSSWKLTLEGWGSRNPLEDYIELSQKEIDMMFDAADNKQKSILSKYLKQDDGSVDLSKIACEVYLNSQQAMIEIRNRYEYCDKAFWLTNRYDWEIKKDSKGQLCLIPTKKK